MLRAFVLAAVALSLSLTPASAKVKPHIPPFRMPTGWPVSISIPPIKVQASIEHLALNGPKAVDAPFKWGDVGWYDLSARPGTVGHAIMFGHLDSTCCPAVFWLLKDLKPKQTILVHYKWKKPLQFRVMWTKDYPDTHLPAKFMYGPTTQRGLILFTCSGVFHYDGSGYDHKVVVYARLIMPGGKLG